MGLFGLFGNKDASERKEEKNIPWLALTSVDQLKEIKRRSLSKTQVIFKHSTTCGISRMVINMFKENYALTADQIDLYYLDLHAYREVSNEAGYAFQLLHQSPQLLVIKKDTLVAHASHGAIAEVDLAAYL